MFLRECSIQGACNYHHFLSGKVFLVICEDGSENTIRFFNKDFIHLSGIKSNLSDNTFFESCKKNQLSEGNILTRQKYNWQTLKGKGIRLRNIHRIVYADVKDSLFVFHLHTNTADFPVAIRNSITNTCVGYQNDIHQARTLRKFTNSACSESEKRISAIFAKSESQKKYDELVYISNFRNVYNKNGVFPDLLSESLKERLPI